MLGVGMQEMMIIGLAALLIFGPGKLPEVMGQAGKMYRDFRNMTAELTGEFDKTIAEAREMGNQITGELGPMQKELNSVTRSVERDLGGKKKTTSSSKSSTGSKATSSTGSKSTTAKKSTSTASRSGSTSSKSTSSSRSTTTSSASKTTSTAKKEIAPVATKEDPYSDVSMFAPEPPKRERRARKATPSVITDITPRSLAAVDDEMATGTPLAGITPVDDALARARARRRSAGYARTGS